MGVGVDVGGGGGVAVAVGGTSTGGVDVPAGGALVEVQA